MWEIPTEVNVLLDWEVNFTIGLEDYYQSQMNGVKFVKWPNRSARYMHKHIVNNLGSQK